MIVSAVRDLEKPTRAGGDSVRAGESARAFLTVSNSNLKFWCQVADVDMNTILRTYCQGGKPEYAGGGFGGGYSAGGGRRR